MPTISGEAGCGVTILGRANWSWCLWLAGCLLLALRANDVGATGSVVRIRSDEGRYVLERNGEPFFVKGAVGSYRLDLMAAAGANSVRTDHRGLDAAQQAGLTCLVRLPLGNPRHGFDYEDRGRLDAQFEKTRSLVRQYRGHPALLAWNLGNEPEIDTTADQRVALWKEVNRLAFMVKEEDPKHPVIAVLGDGYRRMLHELDEYCPALDAVGLNAYADMLTLPEDVARAGWRRPYLVTEFGPRGHWQVPKTPWRMPIEDTSTAKADFYLEAYRHAVEGRSQCLGAYAFYWSHKQEKTHTWYGMFLPDGSRTAAVDAMTLLWSGRWPANRCPRIDGNGIRCLSGGRRSGAGETLLAGQRARFGVTVSDPEGDPIEVAWELRVDVADNPAVGGDREPATAPIQRAIVGTAEEGRIAVVELPRKPGPYRLYVYARDGHGNAATANLPILSVMPHRSEAEPP